MDEQASGEGDDDQLAALLRQADGVCLVYDITRRNTLHRCEGELCQLLRRSRHVAREPDHVPTGAAPRNVCALLRPRRLLAGAI